MPSVLPDIRFTNKNVCALIFEVHAGTQAEMAGKTTFPVSQTAEESGTGVQGTFQSIWDCEGPKSIPKSQALFEPVSFRPS